MLNLHFFSKIPIEKGWSCDKKYCVTTEDGSKYLLRISDISQYESKLMEFNMAKRVASMGVSMCIPIEFGVCDEGVYSLQTWIDGEDAENVIHQLPESQQYAYGFEAGKQLKIIHSIPAPSTTVQWEKRFNAKIDRKIKMYADCHLKYQNGQAFIDYIETHRHLLEDRPQTYQHGDYHIGNMMIGKDGKLYIIDFNRNDFGDPWEEFNRIVWCAQVSPAFATGLVNGYFDNDVPLLFWDLLALYISSNTLSSLPWAIPFGQSEMDVMVDQANQVLLWYDSMKAPVPAWYGGGCCLQYADGIAYRLKSEFDFSFLSKYGKVFKVFDDQDSGNICFGTEKDGKRYFIKFAGAPTFRYNGKTKDAVMRLKNTVHIYAELKHKNLIELVCAEETEKGFLMVFTWAEGECMGRQYLASHRKIMELPSEEKLKIFTDILDFFEYIARENYLAVDFYDGSIMYDIATRKTTVCDIDFFRKSPSVNDMGRMWGSSRFQAPEEFVLGAALDELTNVYTLGAVAFALFGNYSRRDEDWTLSKNLFDIAAKATNADRNLRQNSIKQFVAEWKEEL